MIDGDSQASDGDIVAAILDEDATIKRFRHRRGEVTLEPANPAYQPIPVRGDKNFQIVGKVVGVFRKL